LLWMVDRIKGRGQATETPIGLVPTPQALNLDGLDISREDLQALLRVDSEEWAAEVPEMRAFFDKFGASLPHELSDALERLAKGVDATASVS
jgi:phosphoenolpyruvate carboxykinase (GTP)